jgi:selenocysteine-specific elongation factor
VSANHYILATAGHVDHGKSALVRALTGTDPDRLPEEKRRGITIDLGFAHLVLPNPRNPASPFDLGMVDVPGHEDFVKNMVAGVGSIDLALLVVAADDGWMRQTEEHLQILIYLGVEHAVVALTKCDLVEDRRPVSDSIRAHLAGTSFERAPIVATSTLTGEGIVDLADVLAEVLGHVTPARNAGKPRLPVDRAFSLTGVGTVVTGTLTGGSFTRNQAVILQPGGRTAKIRSLQSHGRELDTAGPGLRTALSIPEVPLAGAASDGVARGQVVTVPELGGAVRTFDVEIQRSSRLEPEQLTARPLKDGTRIRLHHASAHVTGYVVLKTPVAAGGRSVGQLRLDEPIFVLGGDRFILRDWPGQNTLAGGLVLDADSSPEQFRTESQQRLLQRRAQMPTDVEAWIESQLERDHVHPRNQLLARTRFDGATIDAAMKQLVQSGRVVDLSTQLAWGDWWRLMRQMVIERTRQEHQSRPERLGLALTELRSALAQQIAEQNIFDLLVAEVSRAELIRDGTMLRDRAHRPSLPANLQAVGARVRALLSAKPLEPPSRKELAAEPLAPQAIRFLLESGEAVSVGPELIMLSDAIVRAREAVRRHITQKGPATASDLRQVLATNRRVIIPLLEYFDREGFTLREGDQRRLRSHHE